MTARYSPIDWETAVSLGSRIAGEGPVTNRAEADAVVAELRAGAARSTALVREFTGLEAAHHDAPVLVVDRPGWIRANADGFAMLIDPVVAKLAQNPAHSPSRPSSFGSAIGA